MKNSILTYCRLLALLAVLWMCGGNVAASGRGTILADSLQHADSLAMQPARDGGAPADSLHATADSIAANDQKKGSPQGHAAAGATVGSPGYGDYDLGGRGLVGRLPKPEYSGTNDEGTIVVEVLVAPDGRVVQANVTPSGSKGTAASNATLRSRAEAAARRAVFERKASGNENQWGSITYYFKQN